MSVSINIVAHQNGVGLSRDTRLLADALALTGADVAVTSVDPVARKRRRSIWVQLGARLGRWRTPPPPKFDLNVMLEHIWPEHFDLARENVIVPNPEWYDRHNERVTWGVDHVWAKTQHARAIFEARGLPTTFIGFDSEDRLRADVPREPTFFHLAGKSPLKGTERLLALWAKHPEWPSLTLVQSRATDVPMPTAANILPRLEYISDEELLRLQNGCAFHLCPSETEGWGHYIVEGLSVGAAVLTVDAAPMNELITPERGFLVSDAMRGRKRLATTHQFDEAKLAEAVEKMIALSPAQREAIRGAGRTWFVDNKQHFARRLEDGINAVLSRRTAIAS